MNYGYDLTTNCRYFIIGIIGLAKLYYCCYLDLIADIIFTFPLEQDCPLSPAYPLQGSGISWRTSCSPSMWRWRRGGGRGGRIQKSPGHDPDFPWETSWHWWSSRWTPSRWGRWSDLAGAPRCPPGPWWDWGLGWCGLWFCNTDHIGLGSRCNTQAQSPGRRN